MEVPELRDRIELGRYIKAMRVRRGWSQRRLEREAGLPTHAVHNIERGHEPGYLKMMKILRALDGET